MRRSHTVSLIATVVLTAIAVFGALAAGWGPVLGLDLRGGVAVVLEPSEETDSETLDQAIEIIRNRVDAIGVAEPDITRQDQNVVVQLPGVDDAQRALDLVGQTAELRFRPLVAAFQANDPLQREQAQQFLEILNTPADATTTTTTTTTEAPATTEAEGEATEGDSTETTEGDSTSTPGTTTPDDASSDTTEAPADGETTDTTTDTTTPETTTTTEFDPATAPDLDEILTDPDMAAPDATVALPSLDGELIYLLAPVPTNAEGEFITGRIIDTASAAFNGAIGWVVNVSFTGDGSDDFDLLAAQNVGQQVAIAVDGVVYSAPTIRQAEFDGSAQITGQFTEDEAKDLALVLRFGALPVELEPQTVQTVSATLGQDALDAGLIAGLVGLIVVAIYMIAIYRLLGVVAILSLVVSGAMLWFVIAWLGEWQGLALTLAGATGIVLSIGVAVDSNIVYYESIKEQIRRGRAVRSAANASFPGAFSTIVKADMASIIGALILYWLTAGAVRGFALYLLIATLLDLLVSYVFMRPLVVLVTRKFAANNPERLGVAGGEVSS